LPLASELTINAAKTNALIVFPTTKIPPQNISIKCNKVSVTIQETKLQTAFKCIERKVACAVSIMNRLKFIFPKETRLQLYHALIYPHILYALPVWGSTY